MQQSGRYPEINPKVRSFGEYYGTVFIPTRPYTPRHKGKVERGVDYVQENALRGRSFAGLEEQKRFLRDWEEAVADTRVHGTTRRHVGKQFAEVERAALLPLPSDPFPSFREARRTVHRDGHVEVDHAYYSVPPEYLARPVWVRWDARLVRIFNDRMEPLEVHLKQEPGRFSTRPSHIASEKPSSSRWPPFTAARRPWTSPGWWPSWSRRSRCRSSPCSATPRAASAPAPTGARPAPPAR